MTIAATAMNRMDITTSVDMADVSPPATAANAGSGVLLAEPTLGLGDGSMAALAMLLTKADQQDRKSARQLEDAADNAAMKAENDRVAQMRAKADAEMNAAIATGVGGMVAGALTAIGGCVASPSAADHGDSVRQGFSGGAGLTGSVGEIIAGGFHCGAANADAAAASAEASAQAQVRFYDRAHDSELAATSSIQKVQQFLDQVQQTKNATLLNAATFRA